MKMHKGDQCILIYPCLCFSGTTWMQEILPPLLNGGDLTSVQTIPNWDRVPWLEETRAPLLLDKLPSPRAIVSHMPCHLMPSSFFNSKAKVQKKAGRLNQSDSIEPGLFCFLMIVISMNSQCFTSDILLGGQLHNRDIFFLSSSGNLRRSES